MAITFHAYYAKSPEESHLAIGNFFLVYLPRISDKQPISMLCYQKNLSQNVETKTVTKQSIRNKKLIFID